MFQKPDLWAFFIVLYELYRIKNFVNEICMILSIYSIKQLFIKYNLVRKIVAIILIIVCILSLILNKEAYVMAFF